MFAKYDKASAWVRANPNLTEAWARDWSLTTMDMVVWGHRRLDGELAKIGK